MSKKAWENVDSQYIDYKDRYINICSGITDFMLFICLFVYWNLKSS